MNIVSYDYPAARIIQIFGGVFAITSFCSKSSLQLSFSTDSGEPLRFRRGRAHPQPYARGPLLFYCQKKRSDAKGAIATVITGAFGYVSAPALLKLVRVGDKVAKGVAIGSSSHAFGTLKAFEMGEAEGAMSSLAIAATGLMTVAAAPLFVLLF